jgi:hypothetical protein
MLLIHWHETRSRPRQRNALFALNDAASHVLALLREWRRRSKERTQFAKLDDRMLKDIGHSDRWRIPAQLCTAELDR